MPAPVYAIGLHDTCEKRTSLGKRAGGAAKRKIEDFETKTSKR